MTQDELKLALQQAYNLGQTYWQQANSDYASQWHKSDKTKEKFNQLIEDTCQSLTQEQENNNVS
jgi:hypothetical protein